MDEKACVHEGKLHNFTVSSYEKIDNIHRGSWGGYFRGHDCCGRCKSQLNGRCNNNCGQVCGKPTTVTVEVIICVWCGIRGGRR